MSRRGLMLNQKASRLPSAYQEVEYVENQSGNNEIEINYQCAFASNKVYVDFEQTKDFETATTSGVTVFKAGTYNTAGFTQLAIIQNGGTHKIITFFGDGSDWSCQINGIVTQRKYSAILQYNYIELNGNRYVNNGRQLGVTNKFSIFASYNTGGIRIYSFAIKITDDIELCTLVPCYRKADGEIGFYDIVNEAFYNNIGTGTLVTGGTV